MIDVNPLDLDLFPLGVVDGATAGDPQHSAAVIAEQDGLRCGTWRVTPGEFPWASANGEMFHVIEGEGTITDHNGDVHEIAPGKVFYQPAGTTVHWKVTKTIRKSFAVPTAAQA
ncbi:cupin domain-containing protein [Blastococcus sp. SYSU D00695]